MEPRNSHNPLIVHPFRMHHRPLIAPTGHDNIITIIKASTQHNREIILVQEKGALYASGTYHSILLMAIN
jgi:hypothetical protein